MSDETASMVYTYIPRIGFFAFAAYLLQSCNGSIWRAIGCLVCFYLSCSWTVTFNY